MSRHAYVRVTKTFTHLAEPLEVIAGVELDTFHALRAQYNKLHGVLASALTPGMLRNWGDDAITGAIELKIRGSYPEGTSFFIEVGRGTMDEYVQVYEAPQ